MWLELHGRFLLFYLVLIVKHAKKCQLNQFHKYQGS